jgi:hypothetical protein
MEHTLTKQTIFSAPAAHIRVACGCNTAPGATQTPLQQPIEWHEPQHCSCSSPPGGWHILHHRACCQHPTATGAWLTGCSWLGGVATLRHGLLLAGRPHLLCMHNRLAPTQNPHAGIHSCTPSRGVHTRNTAPHTHHTRSAWVPHLSPATHLAAIVPKGALLAGGLAYRPQGDTRAHLVALLSHLMMRGGEDSLLQGRARCNSEQIPCCCCSEQQSAAILQDPGCCLHAYMATEPCQHRRCQASRSPALCSGSGGGGGL